MTNLRILKGNELMHITYKCVFMYKTYNLTIKKALDLRIDNKTLALGQLSKYKILHLQLSNIGQLIDKDFIYYIMNIQEKTLIRVQSSYDLKFHHLFGLMSQNIKYKYIINS